MLFWQVPAGPVVLPGSRSSQKQLGTHHSTLPTELVKPEGEGFPGWSTHIWFSSHWKTSDPAVFLHAALQSFSEPGG